MPEQLIFTSVPRGLQAGRSGYCTVARSHDLQEGLILPLEQASTYTHLVLPGQEANVRNPTIHLYRKLMFAGIEYRILSQIIDAGADHTGRSNYLAHHLIFQNDWKHLPSPASILRWWDGWKKDPWVDAPCYLDPVSSEQFKELGNRSDIPCAATGEYLALGWDSTFTTFLQSRDSQNDFTWIGTRDEPNAAKRIADLSLFGHTVEEQLTKLNDFSGLISAPEGDERILLERFELILGKRSWSAEKQALGQAQESLDKEFGNIEQFAVRLEGTIKGNKNKLEDFKSKYVTVCRYDKPLQLYRNCLADYINPASDISAYHEKILFDTLNKAKADYQKAKDRIDSGRFPEIGISSDCVHSLRDLDSTLSGSAKELENGIEKFQNDLKEHDRGEQLRLAKEAEERRSQEVQRAISSGGSVGTAADYQFNRATGPSRSKWLIPMWVSAFVLILIAVGFALEEFAEPVNPINLSKDGDEKKWYSYQYKDNFYSYYDSNGIENQYKEKPPKSGSSARKERIEDEYSNVDAQYKLLRKTENGTYMVQVNESTDVFFPRAVSGANIKTAKGIFEKLQLGHKENDTTKLNKGYAELVDLHEKIIAPEEEPEEPDALGEIERFEQFEIEVSFAEQIARLKAWNALYDEAIEESKLSFDYKVRLDKARENWSDLIKEQIDYKIAQLSELLERQDDGFNSAKEEVVELEKQAANAEGAARSKLRKKISKAKRVIFKKRSLRKSELDEAISGFEAIRNLTKSFPRDSEKLVEHCEKQIKSCTDRFEPDKELERLKNEEVQVMIQCLAEDGMYAKRVEQSLHQKLAIVRKTRLTHWITFEKACKNLINDLSEKNQKQARDEIGDARSNLEGVILRHCGSQKENSLEDFLVYFEFMDSKQKADRELSEKAEDDKKASVEFYKNELIHYLNQSPDALKKKYGDPDLVLPYVLIFYGKGYDSQLYGQKTDLYVSWRYAWKMDTVKLPGSGPGRDVPISFRDRYFVTNIKCVPPQR